MKVIQFVRPANWKRKMELEQELRSEKQRFHDASRRAADALRYDLKIEHWIENYPLESALVILAGGYFLARFFASGRAFRRPRA